MILDENHAPSIPEIPLDYFFITLIYLKIELKYIYIKCLLWTTPTTLATPTTIVFGPNLKINGMPYIL